MDTGVKRKPMPKGKIHGKENKLGIKVQACGKQKDDIGGPTPPISNSFAALMSVPRGFENPIEEGTSSRSSCDDAGASVNEPLMDQTIHCDVVQFNEATYSNDETKLQLESSTVVSEVEDVTLMAADNEGAIFHIQQQVSP